MGDHGPWWRATNLQEGFPNRRGIKELSRQGVSGTAAMQTAMQVHFLHRNVRDIVIIIEYGNVSHPWFPR